jgi:sugar phosphate permease
MQFVNYMDRISISVAGPSMMKGLKIDASSFGMVLAAFTFGYAVMQIPGGYLADRFGSKAVLVAAPIAWSIFTGATGFATTLIALISIRVLFGIGEGASNASCYKVVGDFFKPEDRSFANGVWLTALALGPACIAPIAAWLLAIAGWQRLFIWLTLPGLVVAALMYLNFPNQHHERSELLQFRSENEYQVKWSVLFTRGGTWLLFLGHLTFNIGYWGYLGWMPSYLALTRHIELKNLGYSASIPYIFGFLGVVLFGWLGSKVFFRHRTILTAMCYLCAAVSLFITLRVSAVGACVAGLSATALFLYGGFGPYASIVLDLAPRNMRGAFAGFINTGGQIGGFVAPIAVGYIVRDTGSFTGGLLFMMGGLLVAAFCYLTLTSFVSPGKAEDGHAVAALPSPSHM